MKRLLTAAVLIPPSVYLIYWAPSLLVAGAVCLLGVVCFHEYLGLMRGFGLGTAGPFGYAAGLLLLFSPGINLLTITMLVMLTLALSLRAEKVSRILPQAAALLLGILYIFGGWSCVFGLRGVSPHWLFFALVLNWIGDSAAFYFGRTFGRHQLAPGLSPKKTWEGTLASVAASVGFGVLYMNQFVPDVAWWEVAALAALANAAGQVGDLAESAMKRGAGVKDSGSLLPGHGGWLDRLDSSLFAMPVVTFWLLQPWRG